MTQSFTPSPALPFVAALSRAANTRAIYPASHPKVAEAMHELDTARQEVLAPVGTEVQAGTEIQIVAIDSELIVDARPTPSSQVLLHGFAQGLTRSGIESLTLTTGLTIEECRQLVEGLSGAAIPEPSRHVAIGQLQITTTETEEGEARELSELDLDRGEEAFARLREDPETAVSQLDHFVWTLMNKRPRTRRGLLLPAPALTADRALYYHCLNVALLTLAQAQALGLRGQARHDVGKLSLPAALLERRGRLNEREWQIAQLHPELGATLLSGLRTAPGIAIQVAYEHHWRYDGQPSFPLPQEPRRPSLASQLTAVADTYDTLIASHGLDAPATHTAALEALQSRAGTWLDPALVTGLRELVS